MLTGKTIITATIGSLMLTFMVGNAEAKGNIENGADLTTDCIECHGMDGKGNFETPPIAGLKESYILKRLRGFNSGKTKSAVKYHFHHYCMQRHQLRLAHLLNRDKQNNPWLL